MSEVAAPEQAGGLQRVLGVPALFATAYGDVGSSIYYALGLVAASALGLTPLVFLISGIIFAFTAMTYAEGTASFPEAGGASSFARHAFNEFVSFGAAWAQILNYLITVAISAFFVPHYLATFWEPLSGHHGSHWDVYGAIILIGLLCLLNVVGVRETAALNIVLALMDYMTQVVLVLIGGFLVLSPHTLAHNIHWGTAPTATHFLTAIAVAMIAYTGMETISNLAEETRDPARTVPRAMMYVVLAVMAIYATLPAVTLSVFPVHHTAAGYTTALGTTYAGDPILGLVKNLLISVVAVKHAMEIFVSVLAATILLIASNAGVIGISRLSYSMAQHRQVPDTLRRLHPRFLTPWFAIIGAGAISCLVLLPGLANAHASASEATLLGNLYAFGAMLSFSIAHIAVIGLRAKRAELQWTAPLNVTIGDRRWPVFAFLGVMGTGFAWGCQLVLHPTERWIGLGWVAAGLVIYTFYRRAQGLPLTRTVRADAVPVAPAGVPAIAYRSVLVPVIGTLHVAALSAAARIAEDNRSTLYVLAPLEVPLSLPITAVMPEREAALNRELDRAVAIGEQLGVRVVTRLQRTRSVVQTVLLEAEQREAQIVVLGSEPARVTHHGFRLLPGTLDRIVRRARTRVLLVTSRPRDARWSLRAGARET